MIEKKKYEAPQIDVFQVKTANVIATSANGRASTEPLSEDDFVW